MNLQLKCSHEIVIQRIAELNDVACLECIYIFFIWFATLCVCVCVCARACMWGVRGIISITGNVNELSSRVSIAHICYEFNIRILLHGLYYYYFLLLLLCVFIIVSISLTSMHHSPFFH